ncbi:MAG: Uma2 family endonuclease [Verrucomicrobiales bacterium]|nr:Uma2 family endonuclease [Verrucomicrobiales bacterium]
MPEPYSELIENELILRVPPRPSHERICQRLHRWVVRSLTPASSCRALALRDPVKLSDTNQFRPDLAMVTSALGKLWLAAEVINQEDHHADTVLKKSVYEEIRIPRLWIVDPRYENVEVYHATQYGLSLRQTLTVKEILLEPLLPGFEMPLSELFGDGGGQAGMGMRDF